MGIRFHHSSGSDSDSLFQDSIKILPFSDHQYKNFPDYNGFRGGPTRPCKGGIFAGVPRLLHRNRFYV
ncbi:Uncharacterized protein dnm_094640 [Desulfonema magnum]|uniref:Uncharacterized protein n=1 Tax=Desulfonema magnum TaxID=45655 RepID=A0A975BXX9_9BACT|nr:Uncharacterized protein dnm_094640 [Desulfonema magnum]